MASLRRREWITKAGAPRSGWEVSWVADGKQRKKLFTGTGAQARAKELRNRLDAATPAERAAAPEAVIAAADDGRLTVAQAAERWIDYVENILKRERTTWVHYRGYFSDHINPALVQRDPKAPLVPFGGIPVADLTAPDCEALKDALTANLSRRYAPKVLTCLRMMLNDVVRRGEREANPAQAVRIRSVDRGEGRVEIPSKGDLRLILETVRSEPPSPPTFGEVWVTVTTFSGLRPSENRGAAIEDLILDGPNPGIHVKRRADQWNAIGAVKSKHGRRFVPLGPTAVSLLRRWLLVVPRGDGFEDPERPGRQLHPIFPTSIGTRQSLANIHNRVWMPLMTLAGLVDWLPVLDDRGKPVRDGHGKPMRRLSPRYSVNCLRHAAASLMIEEGMNPKAIQTRMGHSSIKVTFDLYGHLFAEREHDASDAARIERSLLG